LIILILLPGDGFKNITFRVSGGTEDDAKKEPKKFPSARPADYVGKAQNTLRTTKPLQLGNVEMDLCVRPEETAIHLFSDTQQVKATRRKLLFFQIGSTGRKFTVGHSVQLLVMHLFDFP
jgi:hypothetical protein